MSVPGQDPQAAQQDALTEALLMAQLEVAETLVRKAGAAESAAEAADFADAQLKIVQGIVVLDPSMSQGGTPLQHDIALEQVRGQNAVAVEKTRGTLAIEQAKQAAAAPTPSKTRTVSVHRDGNGRASEYSVEG